MSDQERSHAPEACAQVFFDALIAKEWIRAAELIHPMQIAQFRASKLAEYEEWEREMRPAIDSLAEVPAEQRALLADMISDLESELRNPILKEFAGVRTIGELRTLSPVQFLARWLEGSDRKLSLSSTPREILKLVDLNKQESVVIYRRGGSWDSAAALGAAGAHVITVIHTHEGCRLVPSAIF